MLLLKSLFMLTCVPFSIYYGGTDLIPILISAGITFGTGGLMWLARRKYDENEIEKKRILHSKSDLDHYFLFRCIAFLYKWSYTFVYRCIFRNHVRIFHYGCFHSSRHRDHPERLIVLAQHDPPGSEEWESLYFPSPFCHFSVSGACHFSGLKCPVRKKKTCRPRIAVQQRSAYRVFMPCLPLSW